MLVRLQQIDGVERSFTDRSGTLIRLSLSTTADLESVTHAAVQELDTQNGSPVQISRDEAASILRGQEWRDASQMGELTAIEIRTLALRALVIVGAIGFGVGLCLVWRRRRISRPPAALKNPEGLTS